MSAAAYAAILFDSAGLRDDDREHCTPIEATLDRARPILAPL